MFFVQLQRLRKRAAERFQEKERPAEEQYFSLDTASLCQSRHRLIDDRLKDRSGNIRFCRALIEERLNIRFCEHAAA